MEAVPCHRCCYGHCRHCQPEPQSQPQPPPPHRNQHQSAACPDPRPVPLPLPPLPPHLPLPLPLPLAPAPAPARHRWASLRKGAGAQQKDSKGEALRFLCPSLLTPSHPPTLTHTDFRMRTRAHTHACTHTLAKPGNFWNPPPISTHPKMKIVVLNSIPPTFHSPLPPTPHYPLLPYPYSPLPPTPPYPTLPSPIPPLPPTPPYPQIKKSNAKEQRNYNYLNSDSPRNSLNSHFRHSRSVAMSTRSKIGTWLVLEGDPPAALVSAPS